MLKGNEPKSHRNSEMSDDRNVSPLNVTGYGWNWSNWKVEEFHYHFQFHTTAHLFHCDF